MTQVNSNTNLESGRNVVMGVGRRRVVSNVLANWTFLFVQIASGLILVRAVTDALGQTVYGAWGLIGGLVTTLTISVLALSHAVPKFVAEYNARNEPDMVNDVVTTVATLMLILTFIFAGAMAVLGYVLPMFIEKIPPELARPVLISGVIMGVDFGVGYTARAYVGSVQGLQRYVPASVVLSLWVVCRVLIVLVVFAIFPATLETYALSQVSATMVFVLLAMLTAKRYLPGLKIRVWHLSRNVVRRLSGFVAGMSAMTFSKLILNAAVPFIIGKFYGLDAVGAYVGARMLPMSAAMLVPAMTRILVPMSSSMQTSAEGRRVLGAMLTKSTRYCVLLSGVIVLMVVAYGTMLLRLLMPRISGAYPLMVAIGLANLATWAGQAPVSTMIGMGRIRAITYAQAITSTLGIILAITLPIVTDLGAMIVIVAAFGCTSIKDFFWLPAYAARQTGAAVGRYYFQSYFRPLVVIAIMTAVTIFTQRLMPVSSVFRLAGHLVLMFAVFGTASIILVVYPTDRNAALNAVRSKVASLRKKAQ